MNAHQRRIDIRKHRRALRQITTFAEQLAKASPLFVHQLELLRGTIAEAGRYPQGLWVSIGAGK
jgi:hypothetical protein